MRVAYLTDVEGSWNKLRTFVNATDGVSFSPSEGERPGHLVVDDGFVFVFGGDAVDRGPWSRRVCQVLLDAKMRQPDRVVLLGGNRDINKLRLPRELDGAVPRKAPPEVVALLQHKKPELLRWIFNNTMGAQPAFDHRAEELKATGCACGDDDVVRSFLTDLLPPAGLHFRYLQQTQLAFRLGNTLYVHGGVADEALGKVPGEPDLDDVDGWIFALNTFYRSQLALYGEHPIVVGKDPPWLPVILYQAPQKGLGRNPASVVYGRFGSDAWNNPRLPPSSTLRWLHERGIRRVVVGHTPCGDLPAILRPPDDWRAPVEIVVADNSRGRVDIGTSMVIDDDAIVVRGKTVLDDDRAVDVGYTLGLNEPTDIGRVTSSGMLIKGFSPPSADAGASGDGEALLFRFEAGWQLHQVAVPRASLGTLGPPVDIVPEPPPNL